MSLRQNQLLLTLGAMVAVPIIAAGWAALPNLSVTTTSITGVGHVALIIASTAVALGLLYLLFQWLRANHAAKETVTENTAANTRVTVREYAARVDFKWGSFWTTLLNLLYLAIVLVVAWFVGSFLWNLFTTGGNVTPPLPSPDAVRDYISWRPSLSTLLQFIFGMLVFLWLAPKSTYWATKLLLAIGAFFLSWYLVNAIGPTGFGVWFDRTTARIDACFRDEKCHFFERSQPSAPKQIPNLPKRVKIPHCHENWSEIINIPPRLRVTWEFSDWPVKTLVGQSNPKRLYHGDPNADGSAVRFCTESTHHVNQFMELTWKPY